MYLVGFFDDPTTLICPPFFERDVDNFLSLLTTSYVGHKKSVLFSFDYYITSKCIVNSISFTDTIPNFDYIVTTSAIQIVYPTILIDPACTQATVVYTLTVTNGGTVLPALPSFIRWDETIRTLRVQSSDESDAGYYTLSLRVDITPGYQDL